jgi:hypothetical protein
LDSFNPYDAALPLALSGGLTTILVLPGSGNAIGGEAFAFKTSPIRTNLVKDMLLQYENNTSISTEDDSVIQKKRKHKYNYQQRWMKMACGENPKNSHGLAGKVLKTYLECDSF